MKHEEHTGKTYEQVMIEMMEKAEALEKRVAELELAVERATTNMVAAQNRAAELEKALRECHGCHTFPTVCANIVDMFFHQLFPNEYNPHKALEAKG
jgi:hypothetical protein